jgi:hypothetical protein
MCAAQGRPTRALPFTLPQETHTEKIIHTIESLEIYKGINFVKLWCVNDYSRVSGGSVKGALFAHATCRTHTTNTPPTKKSCLSPRDARVFTPLGRRPFLGRRGGMWRGAAQRVLRGSLSDRLVKMGSKIGSYLFNFSIYFS